MIAKDSLKPPNQQQRTEGMKTKNVPLIFHANREQQPSHNFSPHTKYHSETFQFHPKYQVRVTAVSPLQPYTWWNYISLLPIIHIRVRAATVSIIDKAEGWVPVLQRIESHFEIQTEHTRHKSYSAREVVPWALSIELAKTIADVSASGVIRGEILVLKASRARITHFTASGGRRRRPFLCSSQDLPRTLINISFFDLFALKIIIYTWCLIRSFRNVKWCYRLRGRIRLTAKTIFPGQVT